jgi:hypothetical protein
MFVANAEVDVLLANPAGFQNTDSSPLEKTRSDPAIAIPLAPTGTSTWLPPLVPIRDSSPPNNVPRANTDGKTILSVLIIFISPLSNLFNSTGLLDYAEQCTA